MCRVFASCLAVVGSLSLALCALAADPKPRKLSDDEIAAIAALDEEKAKLVEGCILSGSIGGVLVEVESNLNTQVVDEINQKSRDKYGAFALNLRAADPTKKIDYRGWAPGSALRDKPLAHCASLRDEHGNEYKAISSPFRLSGQRENGAALRAEETARDWLFFEKPIAAATRLTLTLPGVGVSAPKETLTLVIPSVAQIERLSRIQHERLVIEANPKSLPSMMNAADVNALTQEFAPKGKGKTADRSFRFIEGKSGVTWPSHAVDVRGKVVVLQRASEKQLKTVPLDALDEASRVFLRFRYPAKVPFDVAIRPDPKRPKATAD